MDCTECKSYLSAYIDKELEPEMHEAVKKHLAICSKCVSLVRSERNLKMLLQESYTPEQAPGMLRASIKQELARFKDRPNITKTLTARPLLSLAIAAMLLIMVSLAYQIYRSNQVSKQLAASYETTLQGHIDCISCYLAKHENAKNYCDEYGHCLGLITDTKEIFSFVPNELSQEIQSNLNLAKDEVEITGSVFYNANFIEIENYKVIGQAIALGNSSHR